LRSTFQVSPVRQQASCDMTIGRKCGVVSGVTGVQQSPVDTQISSRITTEQNLVEGLAFGNKPLNRIDRYLGRLLDREAVCAGADAGECDAVQMVPGGKVEGVAVAVAQECGLAGRPAGPHRSDRMDDVSRRQLVAAGQFGLAGCAAAELPACLEQTRAGRAVNRAVHPAAAEQRGVCRVHDRVQRQRRDVGPQGA